MLTLLLPLETLTSPLRAPLRCCFLIRVRLVASLRAVFSLGHVRKVGNALFDELIEMDLPIPSHIKSSSLTPSRINRMFVFLPRSPPSLIKFSAGVRHDPAWYEEEGLSDHAPILIVSNVFTAKPSSQLRLKPQVCKHPAYKERLDDLYAVIDRHDMTLDHHSALLKEFQRDAASFVRDSLLAQDPDNPQRVAMRMSSIARCAWSCDLKFYRTLIVHSEFAKYHLALDHGGPVLQFP